MATSKTEPGTTALGNTFLSCARFSTVSLYESDANVDPGGDSTLQDWPIGDMVWLDSDRASLLSYVLGGSSF